MLYNKSGQILYRKKISMSTGLKVSSLECRRAFQRPENDAKKLNFEGLETPKMKYTNGQSSISR